MLSKIEKTLLDHSMLPEKSVLVALSGGADSVALLHIMHCLSRKYGFVVYAAHVNHCLRGEEAMRDEAFSRAVSENLNIEFFSLKADVAKIAAELRISEELAGRHVRYDFFSSLMHKLNIEFTATAHHKNDNAETILMNFMRGSGLGGLCGIPYKRDRYIRPLLDISRDEIENYCIENKLEYVTDATNKDTVYTRNKIRNLLIPKLIEWFNPNITETLTSNAKIVSDDEDYLNIATESEFNKFYSDNKVACEVINNMHIAVARRFIRKMISQVLPLDNVSSAVVESIYTIAKKNETGRLVCISDNVVARIEYGKLIISKTPEKCDDFEYEIKIGDSLFIPELNITVVTDFAFSYNNDGYEYFSLPDNLDKITVRNRRKGDVFCPAGMRGKKKVKDYMINEKIPRHDRERVGIVTFGDDIAWLISHRRDERFKFDKNGIKIKIIY